MCISVFREVEDIVALHLFICSYFLQKYTVQMFLSCKRLKSYADITDRIYFRVIDIKKIHGIWFNCFLA